MEFEQLLRKYFDGAMTEAELERFQTLLENVPEYRTELRQSLEIRSLLHDDALNLKPPTDLSEHIRIAVGTSFEADAIVEQQQLTRRRPFAAPLRISAGVLAACCLLVGVALSPTLPRLAVTIPASAAAVDGALRTDGANGGTVSGRTEDLASAGILPRISSSAIRAALRRGSADRAAEESALTEPGENYLALLGHEVPYHPLDGSAGQKGHGSVNIARFDPREVLKTPTMTRPSASDGILTRDPAELLSHGIVPPMAYNPSYDSSMARRIDPQLPSAQTGAMPGQIASANRTLTIGVTLGAGQVAENKSPTALLQNSYYFSFSVSGNDRIGVEMGASAFQQSKQEDPANAVTTDPFAKRTLGAPTEDAPKGTPPYSAPAPAQNTQQVKVEHLEQQITYGAVFYDRRLRLSKTWDLCGRVTVGAADNALIGNMRAYAAYTIPNKGVTLTMGVGGSTLYNLTAKATTTGSSGNYGIYYGVETGF